MPRTTLPRSNHAVKMVEAAVPAFIEHGLADDLCFFDAFSPSAAPAASPPA
jgi:hypothetical protein